jgi:hypothetical protein
LKDKGFLSVIVKGSCQVTIVGQTNGRGCGIAPGSGCFLASFGPCEKHFIPQQTAQDLVKEREGNQCPSQLWLKLRLIPGETERLGETKCANNTSVSVETKHTVKIV